MKTPTSGLSLRFWGTRGSLPAPGRETTLFGGNTSCVEVRAGKTLIVLDCGSGMRAFGNALLEEGHLDAHALFSHYHWDHIMGLPFFAPLFVEGNSITLYGESKQGMDVREILSGQMIQPYFPVSMGIECRAALSAHALEPGDSLMIGEARVSCCGLYHPGGALAFRIDHGGRSVVYATDTEHGTSKDELLIELARNADVLIYDSTYSDTEYLERPGWGHSTWRAGVEIANAAGAAKLLLFHHLPERSDDQVALIESTARRAFDGAIAAREGMLLELPADPTFSAS